MSRDPSRHGKEQTNLLAKRLGVTCHVSPLRFRLADLQSRHPSEGSTCLEDWLLDVANARGADFVIRWPPPSSHFEPPVSGDLSNEELVTAICQPHNLDRPQMLRAAAQLISAGAVHAERLVQWARRERAERILAELARQALHVEPAHATWRTLATLLQDAATLREPIVHWTRLAVPIPDARGCNAIGWRLVA